MSRSGVNAVRIRTYIESMKRGHMGKWDPFPWSTNLGMPSEWPGMDSTHSAQMLGDSEEALLTLYASSPSWHCLLRGERAWLCTWNIIKSTRGVNKYSLMCNCFSAIHPKCIFLILKKWQQCLCIAMKKYILKSHMIQIKGYTTKWFRHWKL